MFNKALPPVPPKEDENISLPWNFQHHIHVDEGYVGLPPSWLTAAFTEEEITQIHARRAAMTHGLGILRPPSPTTSLYPSVIQGHRRHKSSVDSTSTPNLPLPPPLRPASPLRPPTTPSSSSFALAPRNILSASSNIVGAVKSSAEKGIRIFRGKRTGGPSSFDGSRKQTHSRLSDETFFAPEIVSPDRTNNPPPSVAPVWELYSSSNPQPPTVQRSPSNVSLSRSITPSFLSRSLSRSKSQSSLSSARSLSTNAHPSSSTPPLPSLPSSSTPYPVSQPRPIPPQPLHHPHRPPHLAPSHSHSGSMTSLVGIPEASPAPGALVPGPSLPAVPIFPKGSLKRKPVPTPFNQPSRQQHQPAPSIASTSTSSHSRSQPHSRLLPSQHYTHKHSGSTSSQKSISSTNSNQSTNSISNSTSSSSSSSRVHQETPVPMLSLSLPRLSLSLPFGEDSIFAGGSSLQDRFGASSSYSAEPLAKSVSDRNPSVAGKYGYTNGSTSKLGPSSLPKPTSSATSVSTLLFPSGPSSNLASRSTPNLASTSTTTPSSTTPIPVPTPTPAMSPSRRRPLPSSKPCPGGPVPALPGLSSLAGVGTSSAGVTKLVPTPPTPFSSFTPMKLPPSPLPVYPLSVPSVASGSGSRNLPTTNPAPDPNTLLSPPPHTAVFSPASIGTATSTAQSPNSAQLWSEIAQMMDPGMLSAIPGLHLSTALPEDAKDVVRRAGEGDGSEQKGKGGGEGMLVGDLVGPSPPGSGGVIESTSTSRVDENDGDDSEDEDEEAYDGVVQSASVVVAPHSPLPQPHAFQAQPLIPRVIEPLRTVGRLVNVNVNGMAEENKGDVDTLKISARENRDSVRSSTATIVLPSGAHEEDTVGLKDANQKAHHRPPSMKLVLPNGFEHAGLGVESAARTAMTEGGNATPFLSYYLEATPSPLPSPGSALGSPLRDGPMSEGEEGLTPTTPFSAMYSSRRYGFEDGYEPGYDEYLLRQNFNGGDEDEDDIYAEYTEEDVKAGEKVSSHVPRRQSRPLPLATPTIVLNDGAHSPANDDNDKTRNQPTISTSSSATDLSDNSLSPSAPSPFQQRYRGWVSSLVTPLSDFIDEAVDPRDHYLDLTEIAEGESGSVYAARVNKVNAKKLRLGEVVRMQDLDDLGLHEGDEEEDMEEDGKEKTKLVAIKSIALVPSGTPKLVDLQRELGLMKGLWHSQVLSVDAVYVDLLEDSVWLRMELMERSLADVIVLVESGLVLQERTIARFASDVLLALDFLVLHNIAHRDVRSDNMLLNNQGILKLADFSNSVRVDPARPLYTDVVGVPYWQAPELLLVPSSTTTTTTSGSDPKGGRTVPPYDPLKLDVWSLGSTVWEMAETVPPFYDTNTFEDRWPPLSRPGLYSPAFHEFLKNCSEPAAIRPSAVDLLKAPFINNACGRPVIVQLLAQCRTIEWALREQNDNGS